MKKNIILSLFIMIQLHCFSSHADNVSTEEEVSGKNTPEVTEINNTKDNMTDTQEIKKHLKFL